MSLSPWLHTALDFVFPAECQYCGGFLGDCRTIVFCQSCWMQIAPLTGPMCALCGDLLPAARSQPDADGRLCQHCRALPPHMDRVLTATAYAQVAKTAIRCFKFHQAAGLGKPLAQLILTQLPQHVDAHAYQGILPVPLHPHHQRQRGYNQAEILAREIAAHLRIPLLRHALRRVRQTSQQARLTHRQARHVNIQGAFQVVKPAAVSGKALILVDDVVTTGATVSECARMLKQAGATSVLVLAVARRVLEIQDNAKMNSTEK